MSTPRELRDRFTNDGIPVDRQQEIPKEQSSVICGLIGMVAEDMGEIIISDIEGMIDKEYRAALEGYVLCLSRILDHNVAWKHICNAFKNKNEKVPGKYFAQFGKKEEEPTPPKRLSVS